MDIRAGLALLLVTTLAAGCAGPAPAAPGATTSSVTTAAVAAPAKTVNATLATVQTPLHIEGTSSAGACVGVMGVNQCQFTGGKDSFVVMEAKGSPEHIAGTVTWTATTPASQEMSVYVLHLKDGSYWWDTGSPLLSGPSPLAFDFGLAKYKDTSVAIAVSDTKGEGFAVGYASASTSQDFVLDGTYTSLVLSAA